MSPEQYKKMFPDDSETLGRMQSWGGESKVAAKRQPWTYTKEVTETITVEDVYPGGISIPPGYEEVGFRPPEAGEIFLSPDYIPYPISKATITYFPENPRILLKQKDLCFKVGDCYKDEFDTFFRILQVLPETITYRTLSSEGNMNTWTHYLSSVGDSFKNRQRITQGEWRCAVTVRCCRFGAD